VGVQTATLGFAKQADYSDNNPNNQAKQKTIEITEFVDSCIN